MHFITFPVASTNIFPLSNSKQGGQLVTEFNLKARDMVATNPDIKYAVGPSFIHSLDDFKIKLLEDSDVPAYDKTKTYDKGDYCQYEGDTYVCIVKITTPEQFDPEHWLQTAISTSTLQIGPGRAVINGHYVETLAPMQVDLNLANAELKQQSQPELFGNLSIGIRTYFSTENTMAGSMLVENTDNMYVGVQLVITKYDEFKTPQDCPDSIDQVTADIKLADFTFVNGVISAPSIVTNPLATRYIDSRRIYDFDSLLDDKYVSAQNLQPNEFYTYVGDQGWCNSVDSLMQWDFRSQQVSVEEYPPIANLKKAEFRGDSSDIRGNHYGNIHLLIPHKQPDQPFYNNRGEALYYPAVDMAFPTADYNKGSSGVVTKAYTDQIKSIATTLTQYKNFTQGKQIGFIDYLTVDDEGKYNYDFPKDLSHFNVGDYLVVREDYTISGAESEAAPSTMYFVLPAGVNSIKFGGTTQPQGIRLGGQVIWEGDGSTPSAEYPSMEDLADMFNYTSYKGIVDYDYFELSFHNLEDDSYTSYYYPVATNSGGPSWSKPVLLTGGVPLASDTQIGGFYNATDDDEYADAGYVYLDDTGHLKLLDYELLRSGTLAYQLGADFSVPTNQTAEYVQSDLDEHVNARVAFKSIDPLGTTPTMIDVNIPLPADEEAVINIYNIDSRFGTGVYIHFTTEDKSADYSNLVINVVNCEKIRIDNSITTWTNGPVLNIFRSCLYYDAELINYVRTCDYQHGLRATLFPSYTDFTGFDGLTLWYSRFRASDPELVVNGMEVSQPNVAMTTEEISFWNETIIGDNHYAYALRSITLSSSGKLIACSMYVSNGSTHQQVSPEDGTQHTIIGGDFIIPQGSALNYPLACIDDSIIITGTYTSAYKATNGTDWIVSDTIFTAKSGTYDPTKGMQKGTIAFNSATYFVPATYTTVDLIEGWEPDTFHIFYGGTTV